MNTLFDLIESSQLSFAINTASGYNAFLEAVRYDPTYRTLEILLQEYPDEIENTKNRLLYLLPLNPNPDFAHPHDVAIACYLMALNQVGSQDLLDVAIQICGDFTLWWSRRLAQNIISKAGN